MMLRSRLPSVGVRRKVFIGIHTLAERRLIAARLAGWRTAFSSSGGGSSYVRAREMDRIYDQAAPTITSVLDNSGQEFLEEVIQIVNDAVEEAGGSVEGGSTSERP